ncbi:hypothetical protein E2C01_030637 [Portunus trituberculatus]|uniref:Uncharacterized protein n=1 Tax=Portunus trituberculatus TaxID=210409 RepID=A0A5B7EWA8_PORTR|nr:hypothetical protein [Portunus trituberculatus]
MEGFWGGTECCVKGSEAYVEEREAGYSDLEGEGELILRQVSAGFSFLYTPVIPIAINIY